MLGEQQPRPSEQPDRTVAGPLYVEPATLHSLGFQWRIEGDVNRNGYVQVHYRSQGRQDWRRGHDLLRMHGEQVSPLFPEGAWTCENLYAGSILFLEPDTAYEVRLELRDPDHDPPLVAGHHLRVRTRARPMRPKAGPAIHLYPEGVPNPANGLDGPNETDFRRAYERLEPGSQLVIHAGNYTGNYVLNRRGTPGKPIVIRAAGDGPVIFEGAGPLFQLEGANHHWFEGLTIRDYARGIEASGPIHGLTVIRCRFEQVHVGILSQSTASRHFYIADNHFIGAKGSWHRHEGKKDPYKAVWLAGQGIDVCHNLVLNHWDGLSTWKAKPTRDFHAKLCALDFYRNEIGQIVDDNEADYGQHNIRWWENRIVNSFIGLSAQPIYGGPCYFVRNVLYNITRGVPFKLNRQPAGVLIYHNTAVTSSREYVADFSDRWSNVHVFNNAFFGNGERALRGGPVRGGFARFDYNAYRSSDPLTVVWTDPYVKEGKIHHAYDAVTVSFAQIADRLGIERHGRVINFDAVQRVQPADPEQTYPFNFGVLRCFQWVDGCGNQVA